MKDYRILENCHYQGVTYHKGKTARLPEDPKWPERFQPVGAQANPPAEAEAAEAARKEAEAQASAKAKK